MRRAGGRGVPYACFIGVSWLEVERRRISAPCCATVGAMDSSLRTVRMFVHVLASTIWVGGQLTLHRDLERAVRRLRQPAIELHVKFGLKIAGYLATGFGAALHVFVHKRWALALGGAMSGLGAVWALFFAISLRY